MSRRPVVLVTGLAGLIGRAVTRELAATCDVRGLDRVAASGTPTVQADVADLEAIAPAFDGVDVVVHLAGNVDPDATFADIVRDNVVGCHNVLEAARRAGVRRVVYASSGRTVGGWERDAPYAAIVAGRYAEVGAWEKLTHRSPVRPDGLYACSKLLGEALARLYADAHGLSAICLRIGHVTAEDRPLDARDFSVWCSQRDVSRMVALCVVAPASVRFEIFFVNSDNRWGYRDLDHPRAVVGFAPVDAAEHHRPAP